MTAPERPGDGRLIAIESAANAVVKAYAESNEVDHLEASLQVLESVCKADFARTTPRLRRDNGELKAEIARLRERIEKLRGELAGPATTVSFLAAEDPGGDAVRWSDIERIFDRALADEEKP